MGWFITVSSPDQTSDRALASAISDVTARASRRSRAERALRAEDVALYQVNQDGTTTLVESGKGSVR